ncbi:hypothetical protein FR483_n502R [Paramecium bursaria Chlorella virus FR483]|uniref:Uncharacterized protein n502R n=1 Tax=Paramecium bursaria Chlorella virus FR483 TaxID=399781 RepID=A7J7K6_PBCVF|nr:hypothetical protein FR483_n502R [Paramecium bursaria Chlorella virus FR483]ABT15787.1 hypothetical protein FR483_n502R [Paramecium bursaria Chlorella virus FR483]
MFTGHSVTAMRRGGSGGQSQTVMGHIMPKSQLTRRAPLDMAFPSTQGLPLGSAVLCSKSFLSWKLVFLVPGTITCAEL